MQVDRTAHKRRAYRRHTHEARFKPILLGAPLANAWNLQINMTRYPKSAPNRRCAELPVLRDIDPCACAGQRMHLGIRISPHP